MTPKKQKVSIVSRVLVIIFSCFLVFGKNLPKIFKDLRREVVEAMVPGSSSKCLAYEIVVP